MNKQNARKYSFSDARLFEFGRLSAGNLENNLSDFNALDSSIDQNYVTNLINLINEAEAIENDEVISDRQIQLTNAVKAKQKDCIHHYNQVKYFAKRAFPDNQAIRNEFGEDDIAENKYSQSKLIVFMKNLGSIIEKYRSELTAVNASDELLDKTETLYEELVQKNSEQDLYISNRPVLTKKRIDALNKVWEIIQQINEISKLIYVDNFTMLKLFLMPHKSYSKKDKSTKILANESVIAFEEGINEGIFIKVENNADVDLKFAVSDVHEETPHEYAFTLEAGKEEILRSNDIMNGTSGMLIAYNETEEEGKFMASLLE